MRSSGCAVQQALTPEAAAVVKQAVVLAKRRGHAQVTPLHVANAMMAASAAGGGGGLLRAACLQSHSHPLQCKALELCFNVALNRLPSGASSILSHHSPYPAISNALVAAFKRAQAHQRRGGAATDSSSQQQQAAILTVKIELEQLIVSILDDPSVSRVMREAGFSSTQVKNNVEKAISMEPTSHNPTTATKSKENKAVILEPSTDHQSDSNTIIETLLKSKKSRNLVVVGESISNVERTVENLMARVERGTVPETLRGVKFIAFPPFYTFCNVRRELVQQKIQELAFMLRSVVVGGGGGAVLYMGDLNWISEYRVGVERERSYYCSVEHMIMEVARLISGFGEIGRLWLMGIATFQTYMKCRNGYNSLEMIWRLHPLTIPSNSLGLSLVSQSGNEHGKNGNDCSSKIGEEAQHMEIGAASSLPPWLKDESRRRLSIYNDEKCDSIKNRQLERTLTLSSSSPSSSTSCFSNDHQHNPNYLLNQKQDSSTDISPSSSAQKFIEFNTHNLNLLCNALEEKVPWQKEIIPEIVGTLLQCRSRMLRRKETVVLGDLGTKEDTWLLFLGPDVRGKEEIARNLARLVFGSYSDFVSIGSDSTSEEFVRGVSENPHRVFLLEDFETADSSWRMMIERAAERGRVSGGNGVEFCLFDAIVVLSCSSCLKQKVESVGEGEKGLDLNMCFGEDSVENVDDLGFVENVDRVVVFKN